ncbi:Periplasmic beta-glucosidase [Tenacibaculum sp. 190524A02b]|uniref:beta-glucosidase n=1 Tax=Tenacibaculum vairaonense TaxID=3137860 RepID=A0ABM9PPY5_9FLAO
MKNYLLASILLCVCFSCKQKKTLQKKENSIDYKVDSLLQLMTLEEKVGQMNQYNGFWDFTGPPPNEGNAAQKYEHLKKGWVGSMLNVRGVENVKKVQKIAVEESRLGIPLIIGFDVIHGYETQSPIPLAESASWDLEAIKKSAQMAAKEATSAGINWTFAPMVDISRDARWGRVMEGAGEDPFLGSKIAKARVEGFQGKDLSSPFTIAACAKHFAAYGFAESGKDYNTADLGTSTLYNTVLPPFKAAKEAGVKTFMNAFNELNGIPATGDAFLQRTILKEAWNFEGFVVSDWGSIIEMVAHGYAKNKKHAAALAANAGSDMDMESYAYVSELVTLVKEGKVSEKVINDAVKRILKVKFELGLFENPYKYCNEQREKSTIGSKEIQEAALSMAKKSIVLLKNENKILPLSKNGQKIALIGALAADKNSPLGNWRIAAKDHSAISVLEGMQKYTGNELTYAEGAKVAIGNTNFIHEVTINTNDTSQFKEAIQVAKKADVVVMVLGEVGFQSGEARSSANLGLPGVQQALLEAVYKVNKNIILVLTNGRPLTINWADKNIPAIVEAWQLGSQAGNAIAQVLYGDYNPSGKLPMTFPKSEGQVPIYYNYKNTGRPGPKKEVFWSHYQDETNTPLYPFGYGLSYTTFTYNTIKANVTSNKVEVSVEVTNSGNVIGKEVVQLYIRDVVASVTRPVKELKGFELVELKPNETKKITFTLSSKELGFYNNQGIFVVEPGIFEVFIGGSSTTTLKTKFNCDREEFNSPMPSIE